ncbi:YjaA family stress response protein [Oceaniserpentilla sp. 4NH20-0058]
MLKDYFIVYVYIKIKKNRLEVKNLTSNSEWLHENANSAFSTARLLVGEFSIAEALLKKLFQQIMKSHWLIKKPCVLVQPLEQVDGGLSEVEDKLFKELALGAGAINVMLYTGKELSDADALKQLKSH